MGTRVSVPMSQCSQLRTRVGNARATCLGHQSNILTCQQRCHQRRQFVGFRMLVKGE